MATRKYLDIFAREAEEHLQLLREGILALEQEGGDGERLRALLRSAHTLKGSARLLDLSRFGEVVHLFEDRLKDLEEAGAAISADQADLLLLAADALEALVVQAHSGGEVTVDVALVLEGLRAGRLPAGAVPAATADAAPKEEEETVRTSVARLDTLVNLLGEILLVRGQFAGHNRRLAVLLARLEGFMRRLRKAENYRLLQGIRDELLRLSLDQDRDIVALGALTGALQDSAMELRMLPLATISGDLQRLVRDLAREQGKEIQLLLRGEETEMDRRVLEAARPMLVHLLRNAVDHGIESPAERVAAGKGAAGRVELLARCDGGMVSLQVVDDGRGIDVEEVRQAAVRRRLLDAAQARELSPREILELVLRPGFSTREFITDVSGRGIGLDVVKATIDRMKGSLDLHSEPAVGTRITLRFPLTLAVLTGVLLHCGGETYAVPLHNVEQTLRLQEADVFSEGGREVVRTPAGLSPLVDLGTLLGVPARQRLAQRGRSAALLLRYGERRAAFLVDGTFGVQELVVRSLGRQLRTVRFCAGATLLGNGDPAIILSVPDLFDQGLAGQGSRLRQEFAALREAQQRGRVLVVDDSVTTRAMEKNILETHGYQVTAVVSGEEALDRLAAEEFDLVVSDVQMPGIDGFELTRRLRETERTRELPVIIVTSLASDADRRRGIEVGAQAYIVKGSFDQGTLLQTVETLIG